MDLHLTEATATDEERAAVDELLGPPTGADAGVLASAVADVDGRVVRGGHEARAQRTLLLPALHALQARVGWISEGSTKWPKA